MDVSFFFLFCFKFLIIFLFQSNYCFRCSRSNRHCSAAPRTDSAWPRSSWAPAPPGRSATAHWTRQAHSPDCSALGHGSSSAPTTPPDSAPSPSSPASAAGCWAYAGSPGSAPPDSASADWTSSSRGWRPDSTWDSAPSGCPASAASCPDSTSFAAAFGSGSRRSWSCRGPSGRGQRDRRRTVNWRDWRLLVVRALTAERLRSEETKKGRQLTWAVF